MVSTKRIAIVDLLALPPVAGADVLDRREDFVLEASPPFEIGFVRSKLDQKLAHQSTD